MPEKEQKEQKTLAQKIFLKPNTPLVVLNAPENVEQLLKPLPEGVTLQTELGEAPRFVLLFARWRAEAEKLAPLVAAKMGPDTIFWFLYPKKDSKTPSDLSREIAWEALKPSGLHPVSQVSVDPVWSALRFKQD